MYYNRFRYYSPESGGYLSQDPIGLAGGMPNFYAYVWDCNWWVDVFGLNGAPVCRGRIQAQGAGLEKSVNWATTKAPNLSEGLNMLNELISKLSKPERKARATAIGKAEKWIRNASNNGGADATNGRIMKTFSEPGGPTSIRIDIEVSLGKAFIPD